MTAQGQAKTDENPATNPLRRLHDFGQAIWLDFLARRFIAEGGLFDALEEPGADEAPIIASIAPEPREIVARILSALNIVEDATPSKQTAPRPSGAAA